MRSVVVYRNGVQAGILQEVSRQQYIFKYSDAYFLDARQPAISLTLPKSQQAYESEHLFPFFFNMLSEGANRSLQSKHWRIDETDHFGILMKTAQCDTVGPIHIKPLETS